jgi:circadian clock protein KaiB
MTEPMHLRLYIAGNAPNSLLARRNLDAALQSLDPASYRLEVIDCMSDPMRTLEDGIVVTPTLRRTVPEPQTTVIGTLSDEDTLRHLIEVGRP